MHQSFTILLYGRERQHESCLTRLQNISNFFVLLSRSNVWSLKGKSGACGGRACENPRFLRLRFASSRFRFSLRDIEFKKKTATVLQSTTSSE